MKYCGAADTIATVRSKRSKLTRNRQSARRQHSLTVLVKRFQSESQEQVLWFEKYRMTLRA